MANGCDNVLEVCCNLPNIKPRAEEAAPPVPLQANTRGCGIRNFDGVDLRIMSQGKNEAKFGEFPWMVAILHNTADNLDVYQCGGALIHRKVVLTAAHCVYRYVFIYSCGFYNDSLPPQGYPLYPPSNFLFLVP